MRWRHLSVAALSWDILRLVWRVDLSFNTVPRLSMTGMPEWTGYILSAVVGVALLVIFFKIISSLMKDKVDFKKKAA